MLFNRLDLTTKNRCIEFIHIHYQVIKDKCVCMLFFPLFYMFSLLVLSSWFMHPLFPPSWSFLFLFFFVVAIFSWGGERGRDRRVEDGGKEGDFIADNVHGPGNPHWEKLLIIWFTSSRPSFVSVCVVIIHRTYSFSLWGWLF